MVFLPARRQRDDTPQRAAQPYSPQAVRKAPRTDGATVTESVCPYCAVGCGLLVYSKGGRIIDIEGNPRSPINEGTLCPKGANSFQLAVNPHRVTSVMYRAPFSNHWEVKPLDWALDRIAQRVKETRDAELTDDGRRMTDDGSANDPTTQRPNDPNTEHRTPNAVRTIGSLGGATLDNEENYLMKKLLGGGLGILSIENQARI